MKLFFARLILVVALLAVFGGVVATAVWEAGWMVVLGVFVLAGCVWAVMWAAEVCDRHARRRKI